MKKTTKRKKADPFIDVRIPYEPGPHLGKAYNRAMKTVKDWVLFIDHDVFVHLNPQWYEICQQAIKQVGHEAGFITCMTNRIGTPMQRKSPPYETDDIREHMGIAKDLWGEFGTTLQEIPSSDPPFSGFFILTHRKAWDAVGGVVDGFYGVDNDLSWKMDKAGYKRYIMKGLYVYHVYRLKGQKNAALQNFDLFCEDMDEIKLHLGCGNISIPGWVNIDKYNEKADIKASVVHLPACTADEIYTSHTIEHLLPQEFKEALQTWYRILKPEGILTIRCPNAPIFVKKWLESSDEGKYSDPNIIVSILGSQTRGPEYSHHNLFTKGVLERYLDDAGFTVLECRSVTARTNKLGENLALGKPDEGEIERLSAPKSDLWCKAMKREA